MATYGPTWHGRKFCRKKCHNLLNLNNKICIKFDGCVADWAKLLSKIVKKLYDFTVESAESCEKINQFNVLRENGEL